MATHTPKRRQLAGVLVLLCTVVVWGATFPVAKSAVMTIDATWLAAIRAAITPLVFAIILLGVEGQSAFRYERRFWLVAMAGTLGFAGFTLFAFHGVRMTSPEHAALISSSQPVLVALGVWIWDRQRPAMFTLGCIALAVFGYALVVTRGDVHSVLAGGGWRGDLLVFIGSLCWLVYVLVFMRFSTWSPLRFTTHTSIFGGVATVAITVGAAAAGWAQAPSADALREHLPAIAFLVIGTGIIGVLTWNAGTQLIGALNAALFYALIPVVAFIIRAAQGESFALFELIGAAFVIGALVANSWYLRRRSLRER